MAVRLDALQWKAAGAIGTMPSSVAGCHMAAGSGLGAPVLRQRRRRGHIFGDGRDQHRLDAETFNLSAAWNLPLCLFIENNRYACLPAWRRPPASPAYRLGARASGSRAGRSTVWTCRDHLAMQEAVAHMRAGNGPAVGRGGRVSHFTRTARTPGSASATHAR